jgi:uncharacterized membrane protein
MNGLPLHPAIVHFPIAFALLVPVLGAAVLWWTRQRDELAREALRIPAALQAVVAVGCFFAQRTGDDEHHEVEDVVDRALIHAHEESGELFLIVSLVTLVAWFASAVAGRVALARKAALVAVVLGIVAAGLGLRAGHKGGELVYEHGAAEAWRPSP